LKAKLIKKEDGYNLAIEQPQGRLLEATCSPSQQLILDKSGASTKYKLSLKNCDEIFGVVDVELMADFYGASVKGSLDFKFGANKGFEDGFNKAMKLNKDKLFTLKELKYYCTRFAHKCRLNGVVTNNDSIELFDNSFKTDYLQQPTEIDVEIVTESINIDEIRKQGQGFLNANLTKPKLDAEGEITLKRI
jgi:hypothetical protein